MQKSGFLTSRLNYHKQKIIKERIPNQRLWTKDRDLWSLCNASIQHSQHHPASSHPQECVCVCVCLCLGRALAGQLCTDAWTKRKKKRRERVLFCELGSSKRCHRLGWKGYVFTNLTLGCRKVSRCFNLLYWKGYFWLDTVNFKNVKHTVYGKFCGPLFTHRRYTVDQQAPPPPPPPPPPRGQLPPHKQPNENRKKRNYIFATRPSTRNFGLGWETVA